MLDEEGNIIGKAIEELKEETGLIFDKEEMIELNKEIIYPSPGGCDEFISIFLCEKDITFQELNELKGKLTGINEEEKIILKIIKYSELIKEGINDIKVLTAITLYNEYINS